MTCWEYKTVLERELTWHGEAGWEAYAVVRDKSGREFFYLKRRLPAQDDPA